MLSEVGSHGSRYAHHEFGTDAVLQKDTPGDLLHRLTKPTGDQLQQQQEGYLLPVTTKDVAVVEERPPSLFQQACAALFYATASLLVIFVNKVGPEPKAFQYWYEYEYLVELFYCCRTAVSWSYRATGSMQYIEL